MWFRSAEVLGLKRVVVGAVQLWDDGAHRVGIHAIAEHLVERGCYVDWVSEPGSLLYLAKPTMLAWKLHRLGRSLKGWRNYSSGRLKVVNWVPMSLFHPSPSVPLLNSRFVAESYWNLAFVGFPPRRISYPSSIDLLSFDAGGIGIFPALASRARLTVYRLSDLMSEMPNVSRGLVQVEETVLREADVVLAVSEAIYAKAVEVRGRPEGVYLLPNGVDVEMFAAAAPEPAEYRSIPRPRAVYLGSLAPWVDWELLCGVAEARQDFSFIVIGYGAHPARVPGNVHMLGPRHFKDLPAYLQHADVGLITFKNWPRIVRVERPLKFYQYLASGLPVVTVSYGSMTKMHPPALLADSPEEFSRALDLALTYSEGDRRKLQEEAKKYSWDGVFERLDEILASHGFGPK